MESFLLDDVGSMIHNKAIERIISPMTVRLCHLIISVERKDVEREAFASLETMAEELAKASEAFVQVATRLAGDPEEEWLMEEMGPVAESLSLSGMNMVLVAQKLRLRPECQSYREQLVKTAQQILVNTTKVLLLEDAATARKTVRAAGGCLASLDALEAAADGASGRGPCADLAKALLRLDALVARGPPERLGRVCWLLRGYVPPLLAAARGHLQRPRDPRLAASRGHIFAQARKTLGELLLQLEPGATAPERHGALAGRLRQLRALLVAPGPARPLGDSLDAPLAAVVWHSMRLAACSAPPERGRLVTGCRRLLELRGAVGRQGGPPGLPGTAERRPQPRAECAALWAAAETLWQGVRQGLLRRILDTFTDTQGPLQRLLLAARDDRGWPSRAPPALAAFHSHARQMLRVAHLVSVCCPRRQTGPDLEAAVEGLRRLVARVQALFSPSHRSTGLRGSPAAQEALLQAWARASDALLARFDDVLDIPEFLSVSTQEMTEHVDLSAWALKRGERTAFSQQVAYVQGRAAHVAQVMRRSVDQERDPIFRNGLRVLIQQLEQSARVLRAVAERCAGTGHSLADEDAFFTAAKRLLDSAQRVREGLDGTNHPDILSPLRAQVHKFDTAKSQPWFILSDLQDAKAFELPGQQESGLGERDLETAYPPPGRPSCSLSPGLLPQRVGSLLPTNEASLSVQPHGHQAGTSASTKLQGQDAAVGVTLGALAGESEMTGLQGPSTLAPSTGEPAREMAGSDGLLAGTPLLCGKTRGSRQGLVGAVGDWLPLCQQLFCHLPPADLPESRAAFMELQKDLGIMVQLAAKGSPEALSPGVTDSMGHSAVLLQMQGRLADVEARAKELLDKIGASDGLQAPKLQEENIEDACLLWSAAVQELLQCVERLSWRQGLFLLPLRRAMKNPQGLQTGLVQAADVSQRLQEAARLSSLLCGDGQVKGAVSFLCREVRVLTEALLDVAQILVSSPKPSPSLSTRFELLCWELTLQAKALTGCLSSINVEYEHALQHAICSSLAACKAPQTVLEGTLGRMVSGIQAVQETVAGSQDAGPCPEGLLVALENILNLTKEVAQRVSELREDPEQRDLYILDCLQWQWAAKAHYAVAQLRAWKGGVTEAWRLLAQCFKPSDEPGQPQEPGPVQPQLCGEEAAAGSVDAQEAARTDPPGSSMEMCTAEPAGSVTAATTEEPGTLSHAPSSSTDLVTGPPTEPTQPPRKEASTENRITQLTREMAKEVFLMAQSSKRRGHALTKDQLITSARKIATSGQNFAKFIHIVAKNCIDPRYSQELLCVVEQIQTMSNQLRIISSVKASLARSKSSEELLLGNAQQLLRVVTEAGRAAEAASLRGLRTPSPDPEEVEVAAVCMQWRRRLRRHRRVAASNLDRGDGGLRKTGANTAPTLSALLEEAV